MKNLIFAVLIFLACEFQNTETFHLVYSITSLSEESVDIDVTYKVGNEYITEQTQTPFIYEQNIQLDKDKNENYQYYIKLTLSENINVKIICNNEIIRNSYDIILTPLILSGFIGFGLTNVDINI